MATRPVAYVARRGESTWTIGVQMDGIEISGVTDKSGAQSLTITSEVDSADTADSNGNVALTAYFNARKTISVTLVYAGVAPKVGDMLKYSDPDDTTVPVKYFQITSCGKEFTNDGRACMMPITAEWKAGWQDDSTIAASA